MKATTPLQIGITGGIGTGKSLICKIFQTLGVPTYDADSRAKYLMTTDGILMSQIKKEFGDLSYDNQGKLNRNFLGEHVFGDSARLERLNELVHPRVAIDYETWRDLHKEHKYIIKEAALLFESGSYNQLNKIIVVFSPLDLRITRTLIRDKHRSMEQVRDIIKRQWPEEEKLKRADYIIYNDETRLILPQVLNLHRMFLKGVSK